MRARARALLVRTWYKCMNLKLAMRCAFSRRDATSITVKFDTRCCHFLVVLFWRNAILTILTEI